MSLINVREIDPDIPEDLKKMPVAFHSDATGIFHYCPFFYFFNSKPNIIPS